MKKIRAMLDQIEKMENELDIDEESAIAKLEIMEKVCDLIIEEVETMQNRFYQGKKVLEKKEK